MNTTEAYHPQAKPLNGAHAPAVRSFKLLHGVLTQLAGSTCGPTSFCQCLLSQGMGMCLHKAVVGK